MSAPDTVHVRCCAGSGIAADKGICACATTFMPRQGHYCPECESAGCPPATIRKSRTVGAPDDTDIREQVEELRRWVDTLSRLPSLKPLNPPTISYDLAVVFLRAWDERDLLRDQRDGESGNREALEEIVSGCERCSLAAFGPAERRILGGEGS
jgi:hypothetical protein